MYRCTSSPELEAITRASGGRPSADEKRFVAGCRYEYLRVLLRNTPRTARARLTLNPKSDDILSNSKKINLIFSICYIISHNNSNIFYG